VVLASCLRKRQRYICKKLKLCIICINKIGGTIKQTNDENENLFEDDQPKVRPIHGNSSRKHTKIPLAPPPNYPRTRAISQPNQQQFLTNLPDQYLAKRPQTPSLTTVTDKHPRLQQ